MILVSCDSEQERAMADKLELNGEIASAIDTAASRGRLVALGYVNEAGDPSVSFRGSTHVHGSEQLAIWVRKAGEGFATAIAAHPQVSLVYYSPGEGPGPRYLSFAGRAHVEPSANDEVYSAIIEGERQQDPDRRGVAVIIDVDSVNGFGEDGPFRMERETS
jgi:hypothetical protein